MDMEAINLKFVSAVEAHRILYDFTLPEYSHKDLTDKSWQQVATKCGMTVSECKEKWKNIRTAFLRRLKSPGKANKKYYLHEALEFLLPFVKKSAYWPDVSQSYETADIEGSEGTGGSADWEPTSPAPLGSPSAAPTSPLINIDQHEEIYSTYAEPSSSKLLAANKRKMPADSGVDKALAEYYAAKKSKLLSDERKESIVQFLNSLLPDLLTLNDPQLRSFKRRTLLLIDEVTGSTPLESMPNYAMNRSAPSPASTHVPTTSNTQ